MAPARPFLAVGTNTLQTYAQPYAGFNLQGSGVLNLNVGGGGVFSPGGDWSGFSGTLNFLTGNWIRELNTVSFGSSNAVWNFGSAGGLYNKYGGSTIYLGAVFGGSAAGLGAASNGTTNQNSPTTYVIGGINTNSIFNGTIYDGNGVGTVLIFNGPGSLTLTGNNTFSGGTTVNGGTLLVNNTAGSGTGSGPVSINPSGALGGNRNVGGQVSLAAGATLAPGSNGSGTLTITNDLGLEQCQHPSVSTRREQQPSCCHWRPDAWRHIKHQRGDRLRPWHLHAVHLRRHFERRHIDLRHRAGGLWLHN